MERAKTIILISLITVVGLVAMVMSLDVEAERQGYVPHAPAPEPRVIDPFKPVMSVTSPELPEYVLVSPEDSHHYVLELPSGKVGLIVMTITAGEAVISFSVLLLSTLVMILLAIVWRKSHGIN